MVVGLGNPGREYEKTRHNIGFMVLMELARQASVDWKRSRQGEALAAEISEEGMGVLLILPLTYMNNSGRAVRDIALFNRFDPGNVLAVVDDIRIDFGQMRLKNGGSDGGHNGLKSIALELGSQDYARLRLGVGAPPPGMDQADYVLSEFRTGEKKDLSRFIADAADCSRLWMKGDLPRAMTQYNQTKGNKNHEQV